MAKHPAAFINMIAESGTKEEAIKYLQETWDEHQDLRAKMKEVIEAYDWCNADPADRGYSVLSHTIGEARALLKLP